jgi:hypothetical protein
MYTTIDYDNLNLKYLYTQCNRTCTRGVYIFNILGAVHISLVWFLPASSPGSSTCVGFATRSSESARRNFPLLPPTGVSPASGTRLDNCSIKFSDTIRPGVARLIWTAPYKCLKASTSVSRPWPWWSNSDRSDAQSFEFWSQKEVYNL